MELTSRNSPLSDDQARQLNELVKGLDARQLDWLSGYLAGWSAAWGEAPADTPEQPAADMPGLTILYGSQTGNTEDVATLLGQRASDLGLSARVVDMADYKPRQLKQEQFLAVLCSTHGEGDPPDNAMDFYEFLHSRKAPSLKSVKYSVLALGDSSYEHFCQTGRDLDERLASLGATALTPRADCDVDYDDTAEAWIDKLLQTLMAEAGAVDTATATATSRSRQASASQYSRKNPFPAPILDNLVLSGRGSTKEVRHVELSLEESGLSYEPGDAVGVYPQNDPALVAAILAELDLAPATPVTLEDTDATLERALLNFREITVLTRPLMEKWARYTDADELHGLIENQSGLTEWMRGRDLLDLIRAWRPREMDADTLVGLLRKLPPRLYSISSSQAAVEDEVHITVASVRYRAHDRERLGVASTWLAERLEEDARVPVYIDPNRNFSLPADDQTPIIMIGPGTGVAPFRAFLQEREERGAQGHNWLFFGDRHFRTDFLYQSEWLAWRRDGLLSRLDVAFSRDQEDKRYVQHSLRENAIELWNWIRDGACIYVCGDADSMAPDVNEALIDIIADQGHMGREQATETLRQLARDKRYQRDVY